MIRILTPSHMTIAHTHTIAEAQTHPPTLKQLKMKTKNPNKNPNPFVHSLVL